MKKMSWNAGWSFWTDEDPGRREVTLPHDAMLLGRRDRQSPGKDAMGYFCGDVYRYQKSFEAPFEWASQEVLLAFDGVYRNAVVTLNGHEVARHAYGYTPFVARLTDELVPGETNTLEVVADNSQLPNSRWYTGGGIYRDVWLLTAPARHIAWQGVRVNTVSTHPARVRVRTELSGESLPDERVIVEVLDGEKTIASAQGTDVELELPEAELWDCDNPRLYSCRVGLSSEGEPLDEETVHFGVRELAWSAGEGLKVNGRQVLLRGACVHHDNGMLGSASLAASEERKVRILKESGYNALRISHNPASTALLEACDKLGMYVFDEAFDMWYQHKNTYDYALDFEDCYLDDVRAMVERDYNHPSVIMYSIGNEMSEPAEERGLETAKGMVDLIHELDASRPVSAGVNFLVLMMAASGKGLYEEGGLASEHSDGAPEEQRQAPEKETKSGSLMFNTMVSAIGKGINIVGNSKKADAATTPVIDLLDIAGYNYANGRYDKEGKVHPGRIIVGSETYPQDIFENWEQVKKHPYLIGDFMWTGWDYLGEAAIGSWNYEGVSMNNVSYPWLLSGAGAIDICGRPGAEAAYASVVWGTRDEPYLGVRPVNHPDVRVTKSVWRGTNALDSWAWSGCEGNKATVEVYGHGATVEVFLNGRGLGRKRLKKCKATYKVRYAPGVLEAAVYDLAGNETGRTRLESATGEARLRVRFEKDALRAGEVAYVAVELVGENGVLESNGDRHVHVEVAGGDLLGFGSAKPNPEEGYLSGDCELFYGQAMAVVRAGDSGELRVTARDETGGVAGARVDVL